MEGPDGDSGEGSDVAPTPEVGVAVADSGGFIGRCVDGVRFDACSPDLTSTRNYGTSMAVDLGDI